jgi:hypothetical protein
MSLRIVQKTDNEGVAQTDSDEWSTRIAKLVPAEALGLYGSAVALVPETPYRMAALWVIVLVCGGLTGIVRYRATRDPLTGKPQVAAIGIALVSFLIWLVALGGAEPTPGSLAVSPIVLPAGLGFAGSLAALLWGTMVPYFYTGDG